MGLLLDKPIAARDLYYFWNWDSDYRCYRVTNYQNYCPTAARSGGFPLGFEFVLDKKDEWDVKALEALAVDELHRMHLFPANAQVRHSAGGYLSVGFPCFSIENRKRLTRYQDQLTSRGLKNLSVTGIQSEWGVIYQPDVIRHAYHTVKEYFKHAL